MEIVHYVLQMIGRYYTIMHNINQIANIVSVLRRLFENERWPGSKAVGWWAGPISLGRPNLQHWTPGQVKVTYPHTTLTLSSLPPDHTCQPHIMDITCRNLDLSFHPLRLTPQHGVSNYDVIKLCYFMCFLIDTHASYTIGVITMITCFNNQFSYWCLS